MLGRTRLNHDRVAEQRGPRSRPSSERHRLPRVGGECSPDGSRRARRGHQRHLARWRRVVSAGPPQRGQIWEYVQGSRQYRTLIVSNDEYNELPGAVPWGLAMERNASGIPGFLVQLGADDPLPGAVVIIPRVMRCDVAALRHNLGFVANETMNAVERGLREFLNLP